MHPGGGLSALYSPPTRPFTEPRSGQRDWYFIAEHPAPAPLLAHPEGCAALRILLVTVPRVSRSCEHFTDGFDLHLLQQRSDEGTHGFEKSISSQAVVTSSARCIQIVVVGSECGRCPEADRDAHWSTGDAQRRIVMHTGEGFLCREPTLDLAFFFCFFTLVTGPRRSLSLKLSDTRVYENTSPPRNHRTFL